MKLSTKLKAGVAALALAGVVASSANAVTETFQLSVTFTEPLSITQTTAANYGEIAANVNTTYTQVATTGVITAGPGGAAFTGTGEASGVYDIVDSTAGAGLVDITVGNQQAGANGFVTVTAFDCDYGGAAASGATCTYNAAAAPGAGTDLTIGFDITVAGSPADGATDTVDFDVTVVFD